MNASMPPHENSVPTLGLPGFTYADLYEPHALARLDGAFRDSLAATDAALAARFEAFRASAGAELGPEDLSALLTETAPHLGRFLARLFRIEDAWQAQHARIRDEDDTVLGFRNSFVAPLAKRYKDADWRAYDGNALAAAVHVLREAARAGASQPDDEEYLTARAALFLDGPMFRPAAFRCAARRSQALVVAGQRQTVLEARAFQRAAPSSAATRITRPSRQRLGEFRALRRPTSIISFAIEREHAGYTSWAATVPIAAGATAR